MHTTHPPTFLHKHGFQLVRPRGPRQVLHQQRAVAAGDSCPGLARGGGGGLQRADVHAGLGKRGLGGGKHLRLAQRHPHRHVRCLPV